MGDEQERRDTVLLSHANPEDNDFTLWLALQLANRGYRVWSDLTQLLGGEVFWDDIEAVIRESAVKVIYVLTRSSNAKDGSLRELHLAQTVAKIQKFKDFVLPVRLDDLPHAEITIELARVNVIESQASWAQGLAGILAKLEDDGVPKHRAFDPDAVADWWRRRHGSTQGLVEQPETIVSNWYRIENLPTVIYDYQVVSNDLMHAEPLHERLLYPYAPLGGNGILTFEKPLELKRQLGSGYSVNASRAVFVSDLISGQDKIRAGPKYLAQLLRLTWDLALSEKLPHHEMANGHRCYWFRKNLVNADTVSFLGASGKKSRRSVCGYKTIGNGQLRYWHYGVGGQPVIRPEPLFVIRGHVLFSDDGETVWPNKNQLARARRNQCRNWWNDEWRDRMYAALAHLAGANESVTLQLGATATCSLSATPIAFESPVSYREPKSGDQDLDLEDYDALDDSLDDDWDDAPGSPVEQPEVGR